MLSYPLSDLKKRQGHILDLALTQPVQLTKKTRPSHVVLSVSLYQSLLKRLETLEEECWGQAAVQIDQSQTPLGSDAFTATLQQMIDHAET